MSGITIVGTGNMGTQIHSLLERGGASVHTVTKSDDATLDDDVVILAVPYEALGDIVDKYRDQLRGKVVVDITNPLDFDTFAALKVPAGSSASAELQDALPDSHVLKAFNTTFAATLDTGKVGGAETTTVLVAGDDAAAKQSLIDAVTRAGIDAVDAGPLARAHELEAIGFLQLTLAHDDEIDWSSGFALLTHANGSS